MTKKVALMQPYLFPYLGYFQLIAAVDAFILADNFQYIKRGWINRNEILCHETTKLITFPLKKGSQTSRINERYLVDDFDKERDKILKTISQAYSRAPCFTNVFPLLVEIMHFPDPNLARYIENSIRKICRYLNIETPIFNLSELPLPSVLGRQERIIQAVKVLGGTMYINPIGGMRLYDGDFFMRHDLTLKFHQMNDVSYQQHGSRFFPSLSIIDVLMFNDVSSIQEKLSCFSLREPADRPKNHEPVKEPI